MKKMKKPHTVVESSVPFKAVVWIFHNLPRSADASDKGATKKCLAGSRGCKESKNPTLDLNGEQICMQMADSFQEQGQDLREHCGGNQGVHLGQKTQKRPHC